MKIIEIFKIKKIIISIIISILFILQPCIVNTLGFWFVAHIYYIALFFNLYAIDMMLNKNKIIIPILINILVLGIYQAFIPLILSVGLIKFIIDIIDDKKNKTVFKNSLKFLLLNIICVTIYILLNKIVLSYYQLKIDFQGMGENIIADTGIIEYIKNFFNTYKNFYDFIFNGYGYYSQFNILIPIILFLIITSICLITILFFNIKKENRLLYIIFILLLIPAFDFQNIMANTNQVIRIKTAHIFLLIFPLIIFDKIKFDIIFKNINIKKIFMEKIYPYVYTFLILFMIYICMGNHQNLINNNDDIKRTINYITNMIISNPEYDDDTNIVLIGHFYEYNGFDSVVNNNNFNLHMMIPHSVHFNKKLFKIAFKQFGNFKIREMNNYDFLEMKEHIETMEKFPSNNCMKKIDKYNLLFKLSD